MSHEEDLAVRVTRLEQAVAVLERRLTEPHASTAPSASALASSAVSSAGEQRAVAVPSAGVVPPESADPRPQATAPHRAPRSAILDSLTPAVLLGWAGAAAMVLAAVYLVGLGIARGWLTPPRQIGAALMLGTSMLLGSVALRSRDRPYAGLLGAGGIVVLYLAVFAAHLIHSLVGPVTAAGGVTLVAILSLALHLYVQNPLYVLFALVGSYSCPLLLSADTASIVDLGIYLTVWNIVYCVHSLRFGSRLPYFLALYGSLLVFDIQWRLSFADAGWETAALFQLAQLALFVVIAVVFSAIRPLGTLEAWSHLPAFVLFYGVEFAILDEHVPHWAPWLSIGFSVFSYGAYAVARRVASGALQSFGLVHAVGGIVLFHAVYLGLVPASFRPLIALALATGIVAIFSRRVVPAFGVYLAVALLLFAAGYLELLIRWDSEPVYLETVLPFLYPLLPYAVYLSTQAHWNVLPLGAGHLLVLVGTTLLVDRWVPDESLTGRLWLSGVWAVFATAVIVLARVREDRKLARSALGLFGLFGVKVLLFDLSGTSAIVRVGCLFILGLSLFGGGWLYRRAFETKN